MRGTALEKGAPTDEQATHPQSQVQGQGRHGGDQWPQDDSEDRRHPPDPPDPGEPLEAVAPRWRERALHQRQKEKGHRREAGQGA